MLGVRFLDEACWNIFAVGGEHYRIYAFHGSSGARLPYTKLKVLMDATHSLHCDLACMGHVHDCLFHGVVGQVVDTHKGGVREYKKFYLITGHYLRWDKSYGQARGMSPTKLGSPKVKFYGDHKDIHVSF